MNIPFSPFPYQTMKRLSQSFVSTGQKVKFLFPELELQLAQAQIEISAKEYLAIMVLTALFYLAMMVLVVGAVFFILKPEGMGLLFMLALIAVIPIFVFVEIALYPTMKVRKKERELEKNLVFALRTMLIEIKSGVTLFDAMQLIAKSNYGTISEEFKRAVDAISSGDMYEDVLQKLATNNPSPYFRKALWQIVNGMKAGGDISTIMKETVKSTAREQRIALNRYSSELKALTLGYLMIGIIVPSLGITLLVIIGSFLSSITQSGFGIEIFYIVLASLALMQVMYIGVIKSRRPTIIQ